MLQCINKYNEAVEITNGLFYGLLKAASVSLRNLWLFWLIFNYLVSCRVNPEALHDTCSEIFHCQECRKGQLLACRQNLVYFFLQLTLYLRMFCNQSNCEDYGVSYCVNSSYNVVNHRRFNVFPIEILVWQQLANNALWFRPIRQRCYFIVDAVINDTTNSEKWFWNSIYI